MTGIVKWFNDSKGYGFIESPGEEQEIFAHYTAIQGDGFKTLAEGQEVEFVLLRHPKGPMAFNIRKVEDLAPILSGDGFSEFWKSKCPSLPWFKAMQKFHAEKSKEQK